MHEEFRLHMYSLLTLIYLHVIDLNFSVWFFLTFISVPLFPTSQRNINLYVPYYLLLFLSILFSAIKLIKYSEILGSFSKLSIKCLAQLIILYSSFECVKTLYFIFINYIYYFTVE